MWSTINRSLFLFDSQVVLGVAGVCVGALVLQKDTCIHLGDFLRFFVIAIKTVGSRTVHLTSGRTACSHSCAYSHRNGGFLPPNMSSAPGTSRDVKSICVQSLNCSALHNEVLKSTAHYKSNTQTVDPRDISSKQ